MFDIGFSELMVIGIVALVVIGPERLPKVARTAGHLFGRLQRYVAGVKADISREMEFDELRKFRDEVETSARSVQATMNAELSLAEQEMRALEQGAEKTIAAATSHLDEAPANTEPLTGLPRPGQVAETTPPSPQMELSLGNDPTHRQPGP